MTDWTYMRVRIWTAFALVACALARGAEGEAARCAPEVGARCQETDDAHKFLVNDLVHRITEENRGTSGGWHMEASCEAAALDDAAWPRYPTLKAFHSVTLKGCGAVNYGDALRTLNITTEILHLTDLPSGVYSGVTFTNISSSRLSAIKELVLTSTELLELQPGALVGLDGIERLRLQHVRADQLPRFLDHLVLIYTDIEEMPEGGLTVVDIEIQESLLKSVKGIAPRLRKLSLDTPKLEILSLYDAEPQQGFDKLAISVNSLRELKLSSLPVTAFPRGFLRGSSQLTHIEVTSFPHLTFIPEDLFQYSPKLEVIDLTYNKLHFLSSNLFSGLKNVQQLFLYGNQLSSQAVDAVAGLKSLWNLNLERNPLGDLCPPGGSSVLKGLDSHLQYLSLAETNATRFCKDYLLNLVQLVTLDFQRNQVETLSCADFKIYRLTSYNADIDLKENNIKTVKCTKLDYERFAAAKGPYKKVQIKINRAIKCNCDSYWLSRVLQAKGVGVHLDPIYERSPCRDWDTCGGELGDRTRRDTGSASYISAQEADRARYMAAQEAGRAQYFSGHEAGRARYMAAQEAGRAQYLSGHAAGRAQYTAAQEAGRTQYFSGHAAGRARYIAAQEAGRAQYFSGHAAGRARYMSAYEAVRARYMAALKAGRSR